MAIVRYSADGLPWGVYEVTYYRLFSDGRLVAVSSDHDVTAAYAESMAGQVVGNQALQAVCRSQPGGLWAYGSAAVERAAASDA